MGALIEFCLSYMLIGAAMYVLVWLFKVIIAPVQGMRELNSFFESLGDGEVPAIAGLQVLLVILLWPATLLGWLLYGIRAAVMSCKSRP